jgi:hypothetical protein
MHVIHVILLGGEFPINVTALCVEKDHKFLDSASIEALIKRLNVLNRCADLLEEVLNKVNLSLNVMLYFCWLF